MGTSTQPQYGSVDTLRVHERRGRARLVKVERRDGTIDEVDVETVVAGVARAYQVKELADRLPDCAFCGRKVVPVDARIRLPSGKRKEMLYLCAGCPSCAVCKERVPDSVLRRSNVARRSGAAPVCHTCQARDMSAATVAANRSAARRFDVGDETWLTVTEIASRIPGGTRPMVLQRIRTGARGPSLLLPHQPTRRETKRYDVGDGRSLTVSEIASLIDGGTTTLVQSRISKGVAGPALLLPRSKPGPKPRTAP